ncbi:MAG: ABC transporter permease [Armatimonadetes bacterium]|nr:ABC transporter permease [Armatimonadota bacterium]MDW8154177.1 ABC transporter permease [Armatimonadota bacterium]
MRHHRDVARSSLLVALLLLLALPGIADEREEVAVPERTAKRLGIREGDTVEVAADPGMRNPRQVRVAVVWSSKEHPAEVAREELRMVFRLPFLETLTGRTDAVDRVVVRLRPNVEAPRIRDDLEAWGVGFDAYTAEELAGHTSRAFVVVSRFHKAIALVTLLAGGIFLVAVTGLRTSEMRREIGALRLVGIGRGTIALAVVGIATGVALLGTLLGLGIGAVLVAAINAYYQPLFETSLQFAVLEHRTMLGAAVFSVLLGILSGIAVAVRLLREPPLQQVGR